MSEPIIKVENLGKKYIIGHKVEGGAIKGGFPTLRDRIMDATGWLKNSAISTLTGKKIAYPAYEEFWALKNVSFEIQAGEIIGIVGRNGAGKSTLLKLLSRITEPTTGEIILNGRVASLLEVGTGFHPELTGRENIYLNGAVLGMSRAEIKKKFDEIVAFSEIEKFLDTPVKRYSSGMYVRLAFAVAAHLEPDILVVDEVLAVGDAAFQKKCLGKMNDVANQEGRTVLFVSHNMSALQSLCQRAFRFNLGQLVEQGPTQRVVQHYLESSLVANEISLAQRKDRSGAGTAKFVSIEIESTDPDKVIYSDSCLKITIGYQSNKPLINPTFIISVYDYQSNHGIFRLSSDGIYGIPQSLPPEGTLICITEPINLTPGHCFVNLRLNLASGTDDYIQFAAFFDVHYRPVDGTDNCPERDWMLTMVKHEWFVES